MSASYLLGMASPVVLTSAGHQGPSVSIAAGISTGSVPAAPNVASSGLGTCRPESGSTLKMQFSPAAHLSPVLSMPMTGGLGPYVVHGPVGSEAALTICGGEGSPKNSTRKSTTLSATGRSDWYPS